MKPRVHAGDPQLGRAVAQPRDESAAAGRVGPRRPGEMAGQVPRGDEVGQGVRGRGADRLVGERERVPYRLAQVRGHDQPGDPEPGGEDLGGGAEVGHDVGATGHAVQRGEAADVVTELPVIVVLDHQRAAPAGPADQGRAPGRGQPRAQRELMGRRDVHGRVARGQVGRFQARRTDGDRPDAGAGGPQGIASLGITGLLERHRAARHPRRGRQRAQPGAHAGHQDDVRGIGGHTAGPAQVHGERLP